MSQNITPWWQPDNFAQKIPYLKKRAEVLRHVRDFFDTRGYLEVETPALQASPCMEPHIQVFKTELVSADLQQRDVMYLHASPEFAMKKLLVAGLPKIYQLAPVFRNAEGSTWHSPAFTMLEWYQTGMGYIDMMAETEALLRHVIDVPVRAGKYTCDVHGVWEKVTFAQALLEYADVDITQTMGDITHIRREAARIDVYVSEHDDWENAVLKIFMAKVEPHLGMSTPTIVYDYPVCMAALSRPKPEDARLAERFEVYVCGIELANAFGELTDAKVQRDRFMQAVALRQEVYGEEVPVDEDFLQALEHGLPACSGNALGIDRLVMLITGAAHIDLVQACPVRSGGE